MRINKIRPKIFKMALEAKKQYITKQKHKVCNFHFYFCQTMESLRMYFAYFHTFS